MVLPITRHGQCDAYIFETEQPKDAVLVLNVKLSRFSDTPIVVSPAPNDFLSRNLRRNRDWGVIGCESYNTRPVQFGKISKWGVFLVHLHEVGDKLSANPY